MKNLRNYYTYISFFSTSILIIFQKINIWDLPLWLVWNLVFSGVILQFSNWINKGASDQNELKYHYWIHILSNLLSSYYVIVHYSPEIEFRLVLLNYFLYFIVYLLLMISGFVIIGLYNLIKNEKGDKEDLKENGLLDFMNETQLNALLNQALRNEDYQEAQKIQKIIDRKFS